MGPQHRGGSCLEVGGAAQPDAVRRQDPAASDPGVPVGPGAPSLPAVVWPGKDMRARVDVDDRDAVQDILDRDAGYR